MTSQKIQNEHFRRTLTVVSRMLRNGKLYPHKCLTGFGRFHDWWLGRGRGRGLPGEEDEIGILLLRPTTWFQLDIVSKRATITFRRKYGPCLMSMICDTIGSPFDKKRAVQALKPTTGWRDIIYTTPTTNSQN